MAHNSHPFSEYKLMWMEHCSTKISEDNSLPVYSDLPQNLNKCEKKSDNTKNLN